MGIRAAHTRCQGRAAPTHVQMARGALRVDAAPELRTMQRDLPRTVSYLEITETVTLISDAPRILTFVPDTRRMKSSSP